uniref:Uncharacterized protein n=1 Tax=Aegilops tauschii TaxID=37682 RepID=N1QUT7_AEGTA
MASILSGTNKDGDVSEPLRMMMSCQDNSKCKEEQHTQLLLVPRSASAGVGRLVVLNEVHGLLLGHHVDEAHPVLVCHAVDLVRDLQDLRPECGGYELGVRQVGQTPDHAYNRT